MPPHDISPTFAPMDRIPVPAGYAIGPGDELLIRAWGKIDLDARVVVDRNGQISLPKVGTLPVAGLRYEQLEGYLRTAVGNLYKDFELNVVLGQLRSIQILVLGNARRPGSYTVGSLSTLVDALFASGGAFVGRDDAAYSIAPGRPRDHRFRYVCSAVKRGHVEGRTGRGCAGEGVWQSRIAHRESYSDISNSPDRLSNSLDSFQLHDPSECETVLERDAVGLSNRSYLRVTMKFLLSSSRLYLASLDCLSARRRVLDQP